MKRTIRAGIVCMLLSVSWLQCGGADVDVTKGGDSDLGEPTSIDSGQGVEAGEQAPDFRLKSVSGKTVSLAEFRDKSAVVILFIPEAWSTLSSAQLAECNAAQETLKGDDAVILAVSVEGLSSLRAWTEKAGQISFPVLSDFWPHGAVAKKYGVLRSDGDTERAAFLVDKTGRVRYIGIQNIDAKPQLGEIIRETRKLK